MLTQLRNGILLAALVGSIGLISIGCDRPAPQAQRSDGASLPANLILVEAPPNAQDVKAVHQQAKDGDEVIVRGHIGGRKDPFVSGRAIMTIIDPNLPACNANPGDNCSTPWDYCCETPETILAHAATIQVVDDQGKPLAVDLQKGASLKPQDEVIVKGKVQKGADGKTLLINASGLYVKRS